MKFEIIFVIYIKTQFTNKEYIMNSIIIREENPSNYSETQNLVKIAFAKSKHSNKDEQNLVARLRNSDEFIAKLSLIAELDEKMVGYALFTKIKIGDKTGLALAPLAVLPKYRKMCIGSKLITKGHEKARKLGYDFCVVLGYNKYYKRYGYKKASNFGITAPFQVNDNDFMVIELTKNALDNVKGVVEYSKAFFEKDIEK